jgi:hypothetical protein
VDVAEDLADALGLRWAGCRWPELPWSPWRFFLASCPGEAGILSKSERTRRKKPRIPVGNRSFSVYETSAINALIALRDGATCSERLW